MMLSRLLIAVALIPLWLIAVGGAALALNLYAPRTIAPQGDIAAFEAAAVERIEAENVGSGVLVLLQDGEVYSENTFGTADPATGREVTMDTRYQMASVSKMVTAWGVMALAENGEIDLDAPVSEYLTRWQLPSSRYDENAVTVRQLLSHTAGLTDGLGYSGFEPGVPTQTLEESLADTADAIPGIPGEVQVGAQPGVRWQYSGGGYTLLQLLIEEVTGEPFADYMQRAVLEPLGMSDATFTWDEALASDFAVLYTPNNRPAPHYQYTALAAASLYATPNDMVRFAQAYFTPVGGSVLEPPTVRQMQEPVGQLFRQDIMGLGHFLFGETDAGGYVIGHDGNSRPALNHTLRLNPATDNGILVMLSGDPALATELGNHWVVWETGNSGFLMALSSTLNQLTVLFLIGGLGAVMILVVVVRGRGESDDSG